MLLTDVYMPGLDGVGLASAIREQRPGIKVVRISGACDHEAVQGEVAQELAVFLQRPIDADRLLQHV